MKNEAVKINRINKKWDELNKLREKSLKYSKGSSELNFAVVDSKNKFVGFISGQSKNLAKLKLNEIRTDYKIYGVGFKTDIGFKSVW